MQGLSRSTNKEQFNMRQSQDFPVALDNSRAVEKLVVEEVKNLYRNNLKDYLTEQVRNIAKQDENSDN